MIYFGKNQFKRTQLCWMCGIRNANTKEHKYKKSDLNFFLKTINDSVLVMRGRKKLINGPKSALVKFGNVLCKRCNNVESKTIDNAYDNFAKSYVYTRYIKTQKLTFDNEMNKFDTFRYLTKNFCCRLYENDVEINSDLISYVNGKSNFLSTLLIIPYSNQQYLNDMEKNLKRENSDSVFIELGRGVLSFFSQTKIREEPHIFHTISIHNNIIFEYFYFTLKLNLRRFYDQNCFQLQEYNEPDNIATKLNNLLNKYVEKE